MVWKDRAEPRRQLKADPKMMQRALRLIVEPGGVVEIRAIWRGGRIDLGYFDDMDKAVDAALKLSANPEIKGTYLTLNRLSRDVLARAMDSPSWWSLLISARSRNCAIEQLSS